MNKTRILIADDHPVVREGARAMLEREPAWEVCGIATDGREAIEQALELKPDILVLDLNMPGMGGREVVRDLKRRLPAMEILVFSAHQPEEIVEELFAAGVKSYIRKADAAEHLIAALKSLGQHKPYFTPEVSEFLFARFQNRTGAVRPGHSSGQLSVRERQIVHLIADGKSNKETAEKMGISVRTVETHRAAIMRKLRIDSVAGLVRYALRNGIVEN